MYVPPEWDKVTYCDAAAAAVGGSFVLTPLYERLRRSRDADAIDNFFRVNQWNFLLIGEKGTGIFFHKDHLAAASWQAAVVGRKKWILCPFTENNLLSSTLSDKSLHLASPLLPFAPCPSHYLDADTRWLVSVCFVLRVSATTIGHHQPSSSTAADVFTFKPQYNTPQGRNFAKARCGSVIVRPGEILYYPSYWW